MSKPTLVLAALSVAAGVILAQSGAPKGDASRGKDLFVQFTCYACHGFSAQNGPGRNRLNPMTMSEEGFLGLVRKPGSSQMPPFSAKVLSDQQAADIWAYLKTLPSAPPAKDIPLLKQIESEAKK